MFDLREVALAALLYDVGKLLQRGSGAPRAATHAEFGRTFLREELGYSEAVCEAALWHHGQTTEGQSISGADFPSTRIVHAAGALASSSRREECGGAGSEPTAPLNSILNFVRLQERPAPASRHAFPATEHGTGGVDAYLPRSQDAAQVSPWNDRDLREGLVRGFGRIDDPRDVNAVMNLLERYGSYVPSSTARADTGDISLFDHSRVTAAIAVCTAGHLNETGAEPAFSEVEDADALRYLFVRGDISGVQKFIY